MIQFAQRVPQITQEKATKCRVRDVYCTICKNDRHVTEACATKRATMTTAATAGSAPQMDTTQEEHSVPSGGGVDGLPTDDRFRVCDSCCVHICIR